MEISKAAIKDVEELADSVVNILADQEHIRKIMKKVYIAAFDTGFIDGIEATKKHLNNYIKAE